MGVHSRGAILVAHENRAEFINEITISDQSSPELRNYPVFVVSSAEKADVSENTMTR